MDERNYEMLENSLTAIASELFRFQKVFEKAISKLGMDDQSKYMSQYAWFSKKVVKALETADIKLISSEGQIYDPGMAVMPLNIDDFEADDQLYIRQMIEPIVMKGSTIIKSGTVILGRTEK